MKKTYKNSSVTLCRFHKSTNIRIISLDKSRFS
nr:MAG TPA: hypothetical protein [Caudoviricetes sp.]